jgi:gas vesicle protein GvpL/GvpF
VSAIYVYGIVPAADEVAVAAPAVGGRQTGVRRIVHGDVAALVSDVERGPLPAARELRAHWRVLEEAVESTTVLPVRFGTVMESEDAVVGQFLAPRHDRLAAQLAELAGKVQLTVKASYEEERLLRGVVEGSP